MEPEKEQQTFQLERSQKNEILTINERKNLFQKIVEAFQKDKITETSIFRDFYLEETSKSNNSDITKEELTEYISQKSFSFLQMNICLFVAFVLPPMLYLFGKFSEQINQSINGSNTEFSIYDILNVMLTIAPFYLFFMALVAFFKHRKNFKNTLENFLLERKRKILKGK